MLGYIASNVTDALLVDGGIKNVEGSNFVAMVVLRAGPVRLIDIKMEMEK